MVYTLSSWMLISNNEPLWFSLANITMRRVKSLFGHEWIKDVLLPTLLDMKWGASRRFHHLITARQHSRFPNLWIVHGTTLRWYHALEIHEGTDHANVFNKCVTVTCKGQDGPVGPPWLEPTPGWCRRSPGSDLCIHLHRNKDSDTRNGLKLGFCQAPFTAAECRWQLFPTSSNATEGQY